MSRPSLNRASPLGKALAASHAADLRRLRAGAQALQAALPAHGVLFDRVWRRAGVAPVRVLFVWPGLLRELEPMGGEIICEAAAADMLQHARCAALFLDCATKGRPLVCTTFQPPQSQRLRASFGADGVVRVRAARNGELLAESEPGQPQQLRAGFRSLTAQDLAPRFD